MSAIDPRADTEAEAETPPRFASRGARLAIFLVSGLALLWQIVAVGFAPHLSDVFPRAALALAPHDPALLLARAESAAAPQERETAARRQTARRFAEEAVAQAPLRAAPFRLLGQIAPRERAGRFMEAAAQRSLNETAALTFLLGARIEQKRHAHAAQLADILMRSRRALAEEVAPALARLAETEEAGPLVKRMIEDDPPWRDSFLMTLAASAVDARTPLRLLRAAAKAPSPRSEESARVYLQAVLRAGHYDFAYEAWRLLLPKGRTAKPGDFYNARFDWPLSASPFDWTIAGGAGVSIEIVGEAGERALSLRYGQGRAAPHSVRQYVKLSPGAHRMIGRLRGALAGPRGLRWRIACIDDKTILGESEMARGHYADWTPFAFDVTVPETGCPLQTATLALDARSPSEWLVAGEMLYSGLALESVDLLRAAQ
jgi:hypothetical protein